ncbi:MAG: glycosyltransferase family 39 protein [Pseudacidovorax sp.]|uniref:ArnT family glycosyltransferase n=1 Tax=Pseudacidovorax sp. TaxID=1934311 RepID=UPI001B534A85|nr:glycosyltransferase family 39 protein [Pseudacidovorax sp.]MBP6897567.1 glycosyltransferase family 39 protein [Pseudacidovorax sp.]
MKIDLKSAPIWAFFFFLVAAVCWALIAGKDLNFDFRNYHLYSVYSLLQNRIGTDYFPAAVSGYLNPLAEVPVYAMVKAEWDDRLVAITLAIIHSLNLIFIWKITKLIIKPENGLAISACFFATLLAFLSPIQLTTLSNTFADPISGLFTLGGVFFLLRGPSQSNISNIFLSGIFFGAGAGLKLTNLLFCPASFVALLFLSDGSWRKTAKSMALLFGGSVFAFLATNGWWMWQMYEHFGNPIFPLYNDLFKSPDFIDQNFSDKRMLTYGAWTWAVLPLTMLKSGGMLYSENSAPDLRLMLLIVIAVASAAKIFIRPKVKLLNREFLAENHCARSARRCFFALCAYFSISYLLWGIVSGIGRYGYVLWLVISCLCVGLLNRYFNRSVFRIVLTTAAIVQITMIVLNGNPSFTAHRWHGKWIDLDVPASLKNEPATYLVHGVQSNSFIFPYLNPQSKFSNIIGQYVQPIGEKMTPNLKKFISSPIGPIRILFETNAASDISPKLDESVEPELNALLSGYGFKIKNMNCSHILLKGKELTKSALTGLEWSSAALSSSSQNNIANVYWTCDLEGLSQQSHEAALTEYSKVDRIFDAIEDKCGLALSPHRIQTIRSINGWFRNYFNTITVLGIRGNELYIHPLNSALTFPLGTIEEWDKNKLSFKCPAIDEEKNKIKINVSPV